MPRKKYYDDQISNENNSKRQWQLLNDFLNRSIHSSPLQKVVYKGVTHDNPESVADAFSNYFFEIFSEKHSSSCCNLQRSNHSFFLFPVSPDDVSTAIKSLKETGPGIDKISARHLKLAVDIISEPLSIIINLAFKHGSFPTSLKIAKSFRSLKRVTSNLFLTIAPSVFFLP